MSQSDLRKGVGRKINSGHYGKKKVVEKITTSLIPALQQYLKNNTISAKCTFTDHIYSSSEHFVKVIGNFQETYSKNSLALPLFSSMVAAGFPSPADDFIETALDLNHYLVKHPAATFFVRVSGDSMIGAGIHDQDLLIVDRALQAKHSSIIIAVVNGELTVKRLILKENKVILMPENPHYTSLAITDAMSFNIWGVVTSVIHQFKG